MLKSLVKVPEKRHVADPRLLKAARNSSIRDRGGEAGRTGLIPWPISSQVASLRNFSRGDISAET